MAPEDIAKAYYLEARSEITQHIRLRDQAMFFYIVAVGALLGLSIDENGQLDASLLLFIPYLSLCVVLILAQREFHIGAACRYCVEELADKHLQSASVVPWDRSESLGRVRRLMHYSRTMTHAIVTLLPAIMALFLAYEQRTEVSTVVWWGSIVVVAAALFIVISTRIIRERLLAY